MPILHWLDRGKHIKAAEQVPYRLLEADDQHSVGEQDSPNMLIQGDNLEGLKALLPYYAGRVKCIYIDPPYNTGAAFEQYDDNLEHTLWLGLMYPRLQILRELLGKEGSIRTAAGCMPTVRTLSRILPQCPRLPRGWNGLKTATTWDR